MCIFMHPRRFKLLVYLRGFHETGPLIRMIWQIVIDTRFFLVVRLVVFSAMP